MDSYLSDQLTLVSNIAMERKRFVCKVSHGIEDIPAFLFADYDGKMAIAEYEDNGNPVEAIPSILEAMFVHGVRQFNFLGFVSEVLAKDVPITEYEQAKGGDFNKELATNPASTVKTGLAIHLVLPSKECVGKFIPYGYDDWGMPVFDLVNTHDEVFESRAVTHMIMFVDYCKQHGDLTGE